MNKGNYFGMRMVGRAQQNAVRRPRRIHETLQLQRRDDVFVVAVTVFVEVVQLYGTITRGNDNCAVLAVDKFVLHFVIYGAYAAYFLAKTALARIKFKALCGVDDRDVGYCLGKGNIYGLTIVQTHIKFVEPFFGGAFFHAQLASRALCLVHIARLSFDFDLKVADIAFYFFYFGIRQYIDFIVLRAVHHFGRENTRRTVKRGKGLVQLRHPAADRGIFFHYVDGESRLGDIQSRLYARNAAAYYQRALYDGAFAFLQRSVQPYFRYGGAHQYQCLIGSLLSVLVDPRALFADIGHLHHVRIESDAFRGLTESRLMHSRRT